MKKSDDDTVLKKIYRYCLSPYYNNRVERTITI